MTKKLNLTKRIFISMFLGALLGIIIQKINSEFIKETIILNGFIKILSNLFLSSIKMMVVPLVFISLTCGASSIEDIAKLGKIGGKTLLFYISTTCIAISIGIITALIIKPGVGLNLSNLLVSEPNISQSKSFTDIIIDIIPTNPIESLVSGNMLQIIFFSILLGISISLVGKKGDIIKRGFESLNEIIMKIVQMIMNFAPIGIFALMTNTFATIGFNAMIPLLKYMFVILLALLIHSVLIYCGLFKILTKLSLKPFFKKFTKPASIVFSTASSNSALPFTIDAVNEMGVDNSITSFTIPLGATINMDGTAIMQGVAAIFISQIYNIELSLTAILTIILTATLASIGTAGVPGVGMVMLSMVLQSAGLPIEGIGLILGIDRILDMCRSTVNTMGDCICTIIISKSENYFNEDKYYSVSDDFDYSNNLSESIDN
ncbi:dicarboxylate/amino acid:cation symporter [Clostridium sp.]|uniref:dicarboxylate/amino acid:cation symporter n=1 Tax=Clostridium sp. TaxID=1506 RepID=UPI00290B8F44|nr:dicarboxylate/amino acid:cation symporter [Clostridium sp.]MDU5107576.1 dicarboxylate/amino acid:cation symporter [Clostridium sp.]